jgi:hypothetical protein
MMEFEKLVVSETYFSSHGGVSSEELMAKKKEEAKFTLTNCVRAIGRKWKESVVAG